jgi:catechol-2,3-dioxygenase
MPGGQDELRQMHERMRDAGARIDRTTDHGMTLSVYFLDPEGNRLEVYTDSLAADEGLTFMRENGGSMKTLDLEKAAT